MGVFDKKDICFKFILTTYIKCDKICLYLRKKRGKVSYDNIRK